MLHPQPAGEPRVCLLREMRGEEAKDEAGSWKLNAGKDRPPS